MRERRTLGLADAERGADLSLREMFPFDNEVDHCSQSGLRVEFRRIQQAISVKHYHCYGRFYLWFFNAPITTSLRW